MPLVTLLTDFGDQDGFVAAMKGGMYTINPDINIVNVSHHIPRGNIYAAAFVLKSVYAYYPQDTIHVVVVDPGVGSERKALCVRTTRYTFVAPDNGVLQWIYDACPEAQVWSLTNNDYFMKPVSNTFHGRDVFGPVAAHLSTGVDVAKMGGPFTDFNRGAVKSAKLLDDIVYGEIIYIDHFGNLVSNIPADILESREIESIHIADLNLKKVDQTYSSVSTGLPLALIGSHGMLEIAYRDESAANSIGVRVNTKVIVKFKA